MEESSMEGEAKNVTALLDERYNRIDEDARLLSVSGKVEYITTMHYIHQYFPVGSRLLEVGAGTGRYSLALAREGYDVTAVELVEHNIQVFREKLTEDDHITILQGNALDLIAFQDGAFDGVLLLGPMYHLYSQQDKVLALQEAKRVAKDDGIIMSAYVGNESVILIDLFDGNGDALLKKLNNGRIRKDWKMITEPPMEFNEKSRLEEIDELDQIVGLKRDKIVSADGLTELIRDRSCGWSDEVFEKYLDWHLTICERTDCIGFANHILDILKKSDAS